MKAGRNVLIPLVQRDADASDGNSEGSTGGFLTAYASGDRASAPELLAKGISAAAAPLLEVGFLDQGRVAVSAVRTLRLEAPRWALYQRWRRVAWLDSLRLHYGPETPPTADGKSAELGLALALMIGASETSYSLVFATGSLSGGAFTADADDAVPVFPVRSLAAKLRLVRDQIASRQIPLAEVRRQVIVIIPRAGTDADATIDATVSMAVREIEALGAGVVEVSSLRDAAAALGIDTYRYLPMDRVLQAATAFIVAGLVAGLGALAWNHHLSAPVAMAWVSPVPGMDAGPVIQCGAKGEPARYVPIAVEDGYRVAPVGSRVAWNVVVGKTRSIDALMCSLFDCVGYHLGGVVASDAKAEVIRPWQDRDSRTVRAKPGEVWEGSWLLDDVAEQNRLVLFATRADRPSGADIDRRMSSANGPQSLGGRENRLSELVPREGWASTLLVTKVMADPCDATAATTWQVVPMTAATCPWELAPSQTRASRTTGGTLQIRFLKPPGTGNVFRNAYYGFIAREPPRPARRWSFGDLQDELLLEPLKETQPAQGPGDYDFDHVPLDDPWIHLLWSESAVSALHAIQIYPERGDNPRGGSRIHDGATRAVGGRTYEIRVGDRSMTVCAFRVATVLDAAIE